ncbi:MAG: glycosyltransferase family 4 protein [Patescibacteria group bacterium]
MRLVIATPLYPPDIGGPATYARLLEAGLPAHGIDVELVKFSEVRRLPKLIRHYVYYRRVLRAARTADLVLALDPVSVGLPAMKAAQRACKPLVVKVVGDYAWEQGQQRFGITQTLDEFVRTAQVPFLARVLRRIQTRVAQSATRVIVPSTYLKGIVTAWGIPEEKITVIYNAVSLGEIGTVPEAVARLPRPLVVTAGRLVPWKHIDTVIDAVAGTSGISLAIVGDGPERAALARRAQEKLAARAVFTGQVPHEDMLAVMKFADVFVLNSSYEGLSHLLIEALVLGVPTIATNVGGNPEVITDRADGFLIPPHDTRALANALARMIGDDSVRAHLKEKAKESGKRFSTEAMLRETAAFLTSL